MISAKLFKLLQSSLPLLLQGMLLTIKIAVCAITMGCIFGLILGILNAKKMKLKGLSIIIEGYILITRGTPLYVQVLVFYFALPDLLGINLSPLVAGILALGCNSTGYISEIIRSGINAIPDGQWEAAYVLGYSKMQTLRYIIIPQMLKTSIPTLTGELATLIKETSILSTIGLMELTRVGMNISAKTLQPMPIYMTIAVIYLVLTTCITIISKKIEKGLNHDNK